MVNKYIKHLNTIEIDFVQWCIVRSHNSAQWCIARSHDSVQQCIARSRDSAQWCIAWSFLAQRGVESLVFRLFLQPLKQQYSKKTDISDLAYPMAVQQNWKLAIFGQKKSTLRYASLRGVDFQSRLSPRIRIYIRNHFSPWISGPKGTVWRKKPVVKILCYCPFKVEPNKILPSL
jgi:hypothetical protein